jgi:hypothetical protein
MDIKKIVESFPSKRIKPVDGMAVTAAVWESAHEYHRQQQQFHALLGHGPGILTGLEVIASDPPDSHVYIRPGIAIAPNGQTIVITEPVRYDFGQASQGVLHLLLDYGESRPQAARNGKEGDSLLYIHDQFSLEAQLKPPDQPRLELARIRRHGRGAAIQDATDKNQPRPNEIDMRFRWMVGVKPPRAISLAVSYVGEMTDMRHGRGVQFLARYMSRCGAFDGPVWVDNNVFLDENLSTYTMLFLVGQQSFTLSQEEMTVLYNYVQAGGMVFYESCRRETKEPAADESFTKLLQSLGFKLEALPAGHHLLVEPFLFAAPPEGYEVQEAPALQIGEGIIFSSHDYGCLWQGEQRGQTPSREAIRAAFEWGGNVVNFARSRWATGKS